MQPRTSAEVIPNDLRLRLSTHSLLDNDPSLARQTALREAARVALVRLKYSMSLRRAAILSIFTVSRKLHLEEEHEAPSESG